MRQKVTVTGNITCADGIRPPGCSKLAKNPRNDNDVTIFRHDVIINFFWGCFVFLVIFSYWSKFHVNIITGSGIMTIFFHKGLTRNPEIGNTPVWDLPNIWRLGQVMDTKFGANVSNKILLNAAKFQGYSSYRFWVIKGKPTGGGITPSRTQIKVKNSCNDLFLKKPCMLFQKTVTEFSYNSNITVTKKAKILMTNIIYIPK